MAGRLFAAASFVSAAICVTSMALACRAYAFATTDSWTWLAIKPLSPGSAAWYATRTAWGVEVHTREGEVTLTLFSRTFSMGESGSSAAQEPPVGGFAHTTDPGPPLSFPARVAPITWSLPLPERLQKHHFKLQTRRWTGVPRRGWTVRCGLPFWALTSITAVLPLTWVVRSDRRHRLLRRRHLAACINCGYDLQASPDRCPECGTSAQPIEPFRAV